MVGYMIGLDMAIRGTEDRSFSKSLDTFTVLGPHVVTADEISHPNLLGFELKGEPTDPSQSQNSPADLERAKTHC